MCTKNYFLSNMAVTRNEATLRCESMGIALLAVTSLDELNCLASLTAVGTFWTSGSNEDLNCDLEHKFAWCSIGFNISTELVSATQFWMPTTAAPSTLNRCLALDLSTAPQKGMVLRNCEESLPYICHFSVDCPKQCNKNVSLFDASGNLIDKNSYGVWLNVGNFTYLLGNKPMSWSSSWQQCCALGMEALNLEDAAEQQGLSSLTIGKNATDWKMNFNYWTSGTRKGAPLGHWSWCKADGPTVFSPSLTWERGQPDNKNGNESCVHFRFVLNATAAIMTDRNCTNRYIYACKTQLTVTQKPACVASCPLNKCRRDVKLFNASNNFLIDYPSYGEWYDSCGRSILTYTKTKSSWKNARDRCCAIGLNLTPIESSGKLNCISKLMTKFASLTVGDYWLSGTNLGCTSNFRWCTLDRDFVNPELRWKEGHPVKGLNCVYLEARNESSLLATADCAEEKNFLCDVGRSAASSQLQIQSECAEIWNISSYEIDLLSNDSGLSSANVSLNLKCFLKCVGTEVGMFKSGGVSSIEMLRQVEIAAEDDPVKMEQGFIAYDGCSSKKSDDECVVAYETYKCGLKNEPDLVAKIVNNSAQSDNASSVVAQPPPLPCVPKRRSCWMSDRYPCTSNATVINTFNSQGKDQFGSRVIVNGRTYFFGTVGNTHAIAAFNHCCALGMKLFEPATLADLQLALKISNKQTPFNILLGETESIDQTREVWCRSRKLLPQDIYGYSTGILRYPCTECVVTFHVNLLKLLLVNLPTANIHEMFYNFTNWSSPLKSFICEQL
ncbi:uncharacterized protein LOC135945828 isoform X2 [Cloeon dipterum]|uniref:uncharacterized protein LOC135945828 isoform X2 n=1 Tax=Cloeon dipterum TaxID=197152 RepID=UPI0032205AE0